MIISTATLSTCTSTSTSTSYSNAVSTHPSRGFRAAVITYHLNRQIAYREASSGMDSSISVAHKFWSVESNPINFQDPHTHQGRFFGAGLMHKKSFRPARKCKAITLGRGTVYRLPFWGGGGGVHPRAKPEQKRGAEKPEGGKEILGWVFPREISTNEERIRQI